MSLQRSPKIFLNFENVCFALLGKHFSVKFLATKYLKYSNVTSNILETFFLWQHGKVQLLHKYDISCKNMLEITKKKWSTCCQNHYCMDKWIPSKNVMWYKYVVHFHNKVSFWIWIFLFFGKLLNANSSVDIFIFTGEKKYKFEQWRKL